MELNFSTLEALRGSKARKKLERQPPETQRSTREARENTNRSEKEAREVSSDNAAAGDPALQRRAEWNKRQLERALQVQRDQQRAIIQTEGIMSGILKGVKDGAPYDFLLLQACTGLSLATSNHVFLMQLEENLRLRSGHEAASQ